MTILLGTKHIQMKCIHSHLIISQNLTNWHIWFKVEASKGEPEGKDRLDPKTGYSLFTQDTKLAIQNAKEKAEHISDPDDIETKYRIVKPSKNIKHDLPVYKSQGSESKMESFHPVLANFGSTAWSRDLADALGLSSTAQYNRSIRERVRVDSMNGEQRSKISFNFRGVPLDNNGMIKLT